MIIDYNGEFYRLPNEWLDQHDRIKAAKVRADVLKELWNIAISKYDEILSLEELNECIEQLKRNN